MFQEVYVVLPIQHTSKTHDSNVNVFFFFLRRRWKVTFEIITLCLCFELNNQFFYICEKASKVDFCK